MNYLRLTFTAFMLSFLLFSDKTFAQENTATKLDSIIVTANPFGRSKDHIVSPVTVLSGDDLNRKLQPTIGETLADEVGIRSTYFGPNASRPVIRGLEGDQINIMQNGINNLDASSASVDHNVAIDPLSVERIEVIRGPAALLYGSKAVGGVVNIIDNRIPDSPIEEKATGAIDTRYNTANKERSASALLEGGVGNYAYHVNGFKRITDNVRIPGFARSKALRTSDPLPSGEVESKDQLINSQSNTEGSTIGLSRFFKKGYFGAAITNYNSNYGTVAEPDVTIDMKQQRIDLAGGYKEPISGVKEVKLKLGISDYKHTEFEGSEAGTVFKNRGYASRFELVHKKLGLLEGVIGVQADKNDFSALGEEAFLPPTTTNSNSVFILEEIPLDKIKFQVGGRIDNQKIDTENTANFGAAKSRSDLTGSGSFGFIYDFSKEYAAKISSSYTQRAPNSQELYANGEHVATGSVEVGDQNLNVQKSYGLDLSFTKKSKILSGEVNFFYNNFQDFITLSATGNNDMESGLPIYNYVNLDAEFYGAEIKTKLKAIDNNYHKLGFEIRGDYVEARNRRSGEALPRISPPRVGASAIYDYQKIGLRLDANYTFAANHVAQNETKTDGYLMLNAYADYDLDLGNSNFNLYLKATNLLNEEARNHVSILKDQAPLAGRSVMIGLKTIF